MQVVVLCVTYKPFQQLLKKWLSCQTKKTHKKMLRVYTDGSSIRGNRGGYSAVFPDFLEESFGCPLPDTMSQTNQTAELTAILEGLTKLTAITDVTERIVRICTDSEYSINCLTTWVVKWKKNDWKTSDGNPVVHRTVIERILEILKGFAGHHFSHVKAHTGLDDEDSRYNDYADRLAKKSVLENRIVNIKDLEIKTIRTPDVLAGIPLAIMGMPMDEDSLVSSLMKNIHVLDKKYVKTALLTALRKTLQDKGYDIEKTKIHKTVSYRLIEKTHLTIEHEDTTI